MAYDKTPQSRNEEILLSMINKTEYDKTPQSREEELLLELKNVIEQGGGGDSQHHYSTTEQVVGTWIDGSTVYEKVYEFSSTFTMANGNQWYNTSFSRGDIDLLIDIVGVQSGGAVYSGLIAGFDNEYISLLTYRYTDLNAFILRYTKTTN